jgi:endonuclease YncB( thermonuclease family)
LNSLFKKNALYGRFFMFVVFSLFCSLNYADSQPASLCVSTHFYEKARVKYVIDGDTVVLTDKRHIRLIGINTPELNHNKNKASEAGAELAKKYLIELVDNSQSQIQLVYGSERFDKHGRTLAHLYMKNGLNIQAALLKEGLAMPLRIAPNLSQVTCYANTSQIAKKENRGLWSLLRYKTHPVSSLSGTEKGFYFISGKVSRVTESRSSIWINLKNNVALRIHKDDLNNFDKNDLMSLAGKTIEANGWLYRRNKQFRMRIRHQLDLKILHI